MPQAEPSPRSSRVVRGIWANVVAQTVNVIGQLVLVPVILLSWGRQLYGEWLTLSAVVGYLAVVDFGMQMFVVNRLNQCHAVGETQEFNRILQSAYFLSIIVSTVAFLLLSGIMASLPLDRWFHFTITGRAEASWVALLLAGQVAFSIPQGLIAGIYRTIGEYPRGIMVGNVQKISAILATVATLVAGGGMVSVAAVQIAPMAAAAVFVWRDVRRRHPWVRPGIRERDMRLALSFLAPSFYFFLIQIAMALTLQGSTLIVGALFGAVAVAVFSILRTLANALRQAFAAINHALWPELTALEATRQFEVLREIFLLSSKAMLLLSVCGAAFLSATGADVVRLWTRGGIAYDHELMVTFLVLLVSQTYWLSASIILASSNNHRTLSICYGVSGILGAGLGYLFGKSIGVQGVVLGILVADLGICALLVPWHACRHIGQGYGRYAADVLLRGVPVAILVLGTVRLALWVIGDAPALLLLSVAGISTVAAGIPAGYFIWLRRTERRRVEGILCAALPFSVGKIFSKAHG